MFYDPSSMYPFPSISSFPSSVFHTPPSSSSQPFQDQILPMLELEQSEWESIDEHVAVKDIFPSTSESQISKGSNNFKVEYCPVLETLESNVNLDSWACNHPSTWDSNDVMNFVFFIVQNDKQHLATFRGEAFANLDGKALHSMDLEAFVARSSDMGDLIYREFHNICNQSVFLSPYSVLLTPSSPLIPTTVQMLSAKEEPEFMNSFLDTQRYSELNSLKSTPSYQCLDIPQKAFHPSYSNTNIENSMQQSTYYNQEKFKPNYFQNQNQSIPSYPTINSLSNEDFKFNFNQGSVEASTIDPTYGLEPPSQDHCNYFSIQPIEKPKLKRGRPRKRKYSSEDEALITQKRAVTITKRKFLWEFLCDLLKEHHDEGNNQAERSDDSKMGIKECSRKVRNNSGVLEWKDKELGIFRIVNTSRLTELWGRHKSSKCMSFEKLTRALRWCKKESRTMDELPANIVYPRRSYRFGPRALNWKELSQ